MLSPLPPQPRPPLPDGGRAMGEGTGVRFRAGGRSALPLHSPTKEEPSMPTRPRLRYCVVLLAVLTLAAAPPAAPTKNPPPPARHWLAITGKPLAATAGTMMF